MDIDDLQNTVVSGQPTVEELEYTVTSKSANIAEASAVAGSDPPDLDLERQIKSLDTLDSAITIDAVANHQSTPVSVQSDSNPQQVGPVQLSLDVMARPAVFIPEPATEPAFQSSNDFAVVDSAVIQNQGEPKSAAPVAFKMMLDLPVETCSRYSTCSDLPMDANKDKDLQNDCEFQPKNVTYCTPSLDLPESNHEGPITVNGVNQDFNGQMYLSAVVTQQPNGMPSHMNPSEAEFSNSSDGHEKQTDEEIITSKNELEVEKELIEASRNCVLYEIYSEEDINKSSVNKQLSIMGGNRSGLLDIPTLDSKEQSTEKPFNHGHQIGSPPNEVTDLDPFAASSSIPSIAATLQEEKDN